MRRADLAAYRTFRDQQPLIDYYRRHAVLVWPLRTTDIVSSTAFRGLDLYRHFYQPLGINYQLAIGVTEGEEWTVGYTLSRDARDFTDDDVARMTLLQAALAAAHHRVAVERLRSRFAALSQALWADRDDPGQCLVVLDERGRVDVAVGGLLPQVQARYGQIAAGSLAPHSLHRLVAGFRAAFHCQIRLGRDEVVDVRVVSIERNGYALLFALRGSDDLCARFGLTPGEYRTLANLARYETNQRVAKVEGVSVATIEKRVTAILQKMRVETRVGAVREFIRAEEPTARP